VEFFKVSETIQAYIEAELEFFQIPQPRRKLGRGIFLSTKAH